MTPTFLGWPEIKQTAYRIYKITAQDKSGSSVHVLRLSLSWLSTVVMSIKAVGSPFFSQFFFCCFHKTCFVARTACNSAMYKCICSIFYKKPNFLFTTDCWTPTVSEVSHFRDSAGISSKTIYCKNAFQEGGRHWSKHRQWKAARSQQMFYWVQNITNMRRCLKTLRQTSRTFWISSVDDWQTGNTIVGNLGLLRVGRWGRDYTRRSYV